MTTIQPPPPGAPPEPGRTGRRAPTIDLAATEFESKPVTESEAAEKSAAAASSAPAGADAPVPLQPSPGMNAGATDPAANPASGANSTSSGGRAAWLPPNVPWLPIGAGVAGGAVVLAVLGIANLVAGLDRKSTRLNSSHSDRSRMPSSA